MCFASDFQKHVRACAEPIQDGERKKDIIDRIAYRLEWSWDKAKRAYYGEVTRPYADEYDLAKTYAEGLSELRKANEEHKAHFKRLEAALRISDPDFHSDQIEALERISG